MKASNENKKIQLRGIVRLQLFGKGSKSEHEAVCLVTEKKTYVLRRTGGNPFYDAQLNNLIGKKIMATGVIDDYLFIASALEIDNS